MIRYRALLIAAGYPDGTDCDALRSDPAFKMAVAVRSNSSGGPLGTSASLTPTFSKESCSGPSAPLPVTPAVSEKPPPSAQLAELERAGKLRRFLAPQLADLIVAQGDESILESHRGEIVVVFCDIRGFTAFAERAEPEEVMALLRDYHAVLGPIVARFEGTLDHYGGDGVMVFFNDPLPCPDPARRAIEMAVAMRAAAATVVKAWRRHGHDIGFGVGISQGYATLGQIGFAERMDYTAIGTVTNLASRLCDEAKDGQILISRRVAIAVEDTTTLDEIGDLSLKGLSQAVAVYNVVQ